MTDCAPLLVVWDIGENFVTWTYEMASGIYGTLVVKDTHHVVWELLGVPSFEKSFRKGKWFSLNVTSLKIKTLPSLLRHLKPLCWGDTQR